MTTAMSDAKPSSAKPSPMHGTFVWYEHMTNDLDAAEKFYGHVVGWTVKDANMPGMRYSLCHVGESAVAGMMAMSPECDVKGMKPCWMAHIGVDDVDLHASKVKEAGGVVTREPQDIPGIGRFAVVNDPFGATFMLFQPNGFAPPKPAAGTPGTPGWHELYSEHWEKAFAFYSGLFGWTKDTAIDMGPMGTYQIFAKDGVMMGGMMNKPPQVPQSVWLYYFNVASVTAAKSRLEAAGGTTTHGPTEVPGGMWIVQAIDPQGAHFAVVGPKG